MTVLDISLDTRFQLEVPSEGMKPPALVVKPRVPTPNRIISMIWPVSVTQTSDESPKKSKDSSKATLNT